MLMWGKWSVSYLLLTFYSLDSPEFKKGLFTKVKGNDAVLSDYINEVRMNFN